MIFRVLSIQRLDYPEQPNPLPLPGLDPLPSRRVLEVECEVGPRRDERLFWFPPDTPIEAVPERIRDALLAEAAEADAEQRDEEGRGWEGIR